jgi:hypothetical protein
MKWRVTLYLVYRYQVPAVTARLSIATAVRIMPLNRDKSFLSSCSTAIRFFLFIVLPPCFLLSLIETCYPIKGLCLVEKFMIILCAILGRLYIGDRYGFPSEYVTRPKG